MMPAVLLAIHDHARRRALRDAVAGAGYRVHTAGSLGEARQVLAHDHVDVAFLDEGLDADGVLAGELRRRQTTPRSRLIRLLDPAAPTRAPAASWRPDASLRGEVSGETALTLLAMLAPAGRPAPSP
jgi:CheY-like chemotaxis protein